MSQRGRYLLRAVRENDYRQVVIAVEDYKCDVNYLNRDNSSPLSLACVSGNEEIVSFLLKQGADIYARNKDNDDPLALATMHLHVNIVRKLLRKANKLYKNGYTASDDCEVLHQACVFNSPEIARLLVVNVSNLNLNHKIHGKTPLHLSVYMENPELVEFLLDNGASPNVVNSENVTPLHIAAISGNVDLVEMLLKSGAEINYPDNNERESALYYACANSKEEVILLLLKYRAKLLYFFEFHDFSYEILNILEQTMLKHLAAGILPITNIIIASVVKGFSFFPTFQKCKIELENMKQMKISDSHLTFYDIFMKHPRVLGIHFRNKTILKELDTFDCDKNFEFYGEMIKHNVEQGKRRNTIYNQCLLFFSKINVSTTEMECPMLPILCIDQILGYLRNSDLENMIKSWRVVKRMQM